MNIHKWPDVRRRAGLPASKTFRRGRVSMTVWPRSFPWLLRIGRRERWLFDRGQNLGDAAAVAPVDADWAERFRRAADAAEARGPRDGVDPRVHQAMIDGLRAIVADLTEGQADG
jgi:hypothetical protein